MPTGLSEQERAALLRMLRAPALWPFALLAAAVGFDAALVVCESRESSPAVEAALGPSLYRVDDLPSADDVRALVVGVRVALAAQPGEPLQTTATRLGYTLKQAQRGDRAVRSFARPGLVTYAHRI